MSRRTRLAMAVTAVVLAAAHGHGHAKPQGQVTHAMHVTIVNAWFDPAENTGIATPLSRASDPSRCTTTRRPSRIFA